MAYAGQLDSETERVKSAAAQIRIARGGIVADWPLVTSIAKHTQAMPGDFVERAAKIATDTIAPALTAFVARPQA